MIPFGHSVFRLNEVLFACCAGILLMSSLEDSSSFVVEKTTTRVEVWPIVWVDGRQVGNGAPGSITAKITKNFLELTSREGTPAYYGDARKKNRRDRSVHLGHSRDGIHRLMIIFRTDSCRGTGPESIERGVDQDQA